MITISIVANATVIFLGFVVNGTMALAVKFYDSGIQQVYAFKHALIDDATICRPNSANKHKLEALSVEHFMRWQNNPIHFKMSCLYIRSMRFCG